MHRNKLFTALFALLACFTAQAHTPLKVAVVDLPRVFAEANVSVEMKGKLATMENELKAKLTLSEQKLAKQEADLSRRRASPKRKENLLKDDIAAYQELANKGRARINRLAQKGSQKVFSKVTELVKQYAAENGIHFVLPADFVIFNAPATDITDAVIDRLNLSNYQIDLNSLEEAEHSQTKDGAANEKKIKKGKE